MFYLEALVIEIIEDLNTRHPVKVIHEGACKDSLARSVAQVHEEVASHVTLRILKPEKYFEERLGRNLSICILVYVLQVFAGQFTLRNRDCRFYGEIFREFLKDFNLLFNETEVIYAELTAKGTNLVDCAVLAR